MSMIWSEERLPNENVSGNHIVSETIFGTYTISWKLFIKHFHPRIFLDGNFLKAQPTLEQAKAYVEQHFKSLVKKAKECMTKTNYSEKFVEKVIKESK